MWKFYCLNNIILYKKEPFIKQLCSKYLFYLSTCTNNFFEVFLSKILDLEES